MNCQALRDHEDHMKKVIDPLPRIEQLSALNYLRTLIGLDTEATKREIEKEYRKECDGK